MAPHPIKFLEEQFFLLTNRDPYPWQRKLFLQFIKGYWPQVVNLPTGAGKTTVLHIWLLALAWSILTKTPGVPRRLAWVVNRRVVVDQVTDEVEALLAEGGGLSRCPVVRELLAGASLSGQLQPQPIAVSTLRGQLADNGDWSRDPSTPAVMIGTVDMIGSRLLFRGYQSGKYHRPMHTGLLGVDTLIVNDEAHLSPAFARLLEQLYEMHPAQKISGKNFHVLLLSATPGNSGLRTFDHSPEEDAKESETFRKVFEAPKSLTLHEVETKTFDSTVWNLATTNPAPRTVVFIEQPAKAAALAERLRKTGYTATLLTGTMRGYERDQLAKKDEVFGRFLQREPGTEPVWLVSTSAGEVGINLTCERMITKLVEADHMLQRLGRLNRFGGEQGEAHVVYPPPAPKEDRLVKTLAYLKQLNGDVSCRSVWNNRPPEDARAERPLMARLHAPLIETWALTTYSDKFVPAISPWLHGKQDADQPQAEIAWRADVKLLTDWAVSKEEIEKLLEQYPVRPQEILREPAGHVLEKLKQLAEKLGEKANDSWLIQVDTDGSAEIVNLSKVVNSDNLNRKLLLLPEGLGTIEKGMFRAELPSELDAVLFDVADHGLSSPERCRYLIEGDVWRFLGKPKQIEPAETEYPSLRDRNAIAAFARRGDFKAPLLIRHPEEPGKALAYFAKATLGKKNLRDVPLEEHQSAVACKAKDLAIRVGLNGLSATYERAGEIHDEGKCREVWQRAMGGSIEKPIAKSKSPFNLRLIARYRHELGSLLTAKEEIDDLLLHLIATHHKAARPYFEECQFDRDDLKGSQAAALESARRFARLQNQFGPWGLAYLEAVFKCADGLVSAEEGDAASE